MPKQYVLRYYDLDSGRRRVLGIVPMSSATLKETEAVGGAWAFALSGTDLKTSQPAIVVGDDQAIPGRLPDASSPVFHGDALSYTQRDARDGLGHCWNDEGRYLRAPQGTQTAPKLQVFPNGRRGDDCRWRCTSTWQTDGQVLQLQEEKLRLRSTGAWS